MQINYANCKAHLEMMNYQKVRSRNSRKPFIKLTDIHSFQDYSIQTIMKFLKCKDYSKILKLKNKSNKNGRSK